MQRLPSERVAVTMWDFSWLTRRHGACTEYIDVDAILDGLVLRGYDVVRIDAFPHLVSALVREPARRDRFTLLPEPMVKPWGNPLPVQTAVRAPLLEFIGKCRARGLRVALSSWFGPDTDNLRELVVTPADYANVWRDTLRVIHGAGLGDAVACVDLCNEFPIPVWAAGAYRTIFGAGPRNLAPLVLPWGTAARREVERYFAEALPALRAEFGHPLTFSSARLPRKEGSVSLAALDFVESHVWLSDTLPHNLITLGILSTAQVPMGTDLHSLLARGSWPLLKPAWRTVMSSHLDAIATIAHDAGKPLWTTEGWATTAYGATRLTQDAAAWHWLKDACAMAVDLAIDRGWTGLCTSNFSQPHFPAVWDDVAWHRQLTARIHGTDGHGAMPDAILPGR